MKEIVCKKFFLDGIPLTTYEVEDGNKKPVIYSFHGFDGYRDGDFYKREDVLARLGYFVVGFDSIMHGERRVPYFESKSYDEKMKDINQIIIQTAQDAILLFDKYLQYYPQVIKNEYYAMGFSMGGAITFYLASIDKRVKAIAPPIEKHLTVQGFKIKITDIYSPWNRMFETGLTVEVTHEN